MNAVARQMAVVTGASTGLGLELARPAHSEPVEGGGVTLHAQG
jgi:short-subunit dehydrogenase